MRMLALVLILTVLASCAAIQVPADEPEKCDTVYQAKQGGVWVQLNDSTWVKDTIP